MEGINDNFFVVFYFDDFGCVVGYVVVVDELCDVVFFGCVDDCVVINLEEIIVIYVVFEIFCFLEFCNYLLDFFVYIFDDYVVFGNVFYGV